MSSTGTPGAGPSVPSVTNGQVLPPFLNLPWGQLRQGGQVFLTPQALEFLQLLFSSIGGSGGINDLTILELGSPATVQQMAQNVAQLLAQALGLSAMPSRPAPAPPEPAVPVVQAWPNVGSAPVPWIPALAGTVTPGAQTYATQWGWSVAVGPLVVALYSIVLTALDGATAGNAIITGLPAQAALTGPDKQAGWISRFANVTLAAGASLGADVAPGAAQLALVESVSAGAAVPLPVAGALSNTTAITGGVAFFR